MRKFMLIFALAFLLVLGFNTSTMAQDEIPISVERGVILEGEEGEETAFYPLSKRPIGSIGSTMDFAILLFSIIIWVFSLFFLLQAAKMLEWIFKKEENTPNPKSGVYISFVISVFIIIIWIFRTIGVMREFYSWECATALYRKLSLIAVVQLYPREYAPGFLLASFFPIAVGLFKLLTVVVASPREVLVSGISARLPWVALVYMFFGLINITASIVTLIKLIRP